MIANTTTKPTMTTHMGTGTPLWGPLLATTSNDSVCTCSIPFPGRQPSAVDRVVHTHRRLLRNY